MRNLKQRLKKKSKEWLVETLFDLSLADEHNADRLLLSLAADGEDGDLNCATTFKAQLDNAVEQIVEHGPGTWKSPLPDDGFSIVADALAVMLPKNAQAVLESSEYALEKLDDVFELQEECELEYLVDAFRHLHLEACRVLKSDPVSLGHRLAELGNATEWGFFDGPPDGYVEVLGKDGLAAYMSNRK